MTGLWCPLGLAPPALCRQSPALETGQGQQPRPPVTEEVTPAMVL